MSFLKFWSSSKKSGGKKDDADARHGDPHDAELEKRRLRHSLSISRSGRFKQRKRERSQIMDKPEIFGTQDGGDTATPSSSSTSSSSASLASSQSHSASDNSYNSNSSDGRLAAQHYHSHGGGASNASPKFTCRNVNSGGMGQGGLRMGHPMVT